MTFQILNTKVLFSARKSVSNPKHGFITFDQADINIGDSFDASVFTVPIDGLYKMTITGESAINDEELVFVRFYKNGTEESFYWSNLWDNPDAENADATPV